MASILPTPVSALLLESVINLAGDTENPLFRPIAKDDAFTMSESDESVVFNPVKNDRSGLFFAQHWKKIGGYDATDFKGTVEIVNNGTSLKFTPNMDAYSYLHAGETEEVVVEYTVRNFFGLWSKATMTITIEGEGVAPQTDTPMNNPVLDLENAISIDENMLTVFTEAEVTDVDAGDEFMFAIVGGADAALFDIDERTGDLQFRDRPDGDAPHDNDTDGVYEVDIQATDQTGLGSNVETVAVTVNDTNDVILDFDDVVVNAQSEELSVSGVYNGFFFADAGIVNGSAIYNESGYENGAVSGDNVLFNEDGNKLTIARLTDFDLESGVFTGAWNNGVNVRVTAYDDGEVTAIAEFALKADEPTFVEFEFEGFKSIDTLEFESWGGVNAGYDGGGTQIAIDDLAFVV